MLFLEKKKNNVGVSMDVIASARRNATLDKMSQLSNVKC